MIMRGKSHTGDLHFYYFCRGRQQHACDLPYLPVARVETAVIDNYATIMLPTDLRDRIAARVDEALSESADTSAELRARVKAQLASLGQQEDRFLDLVGDPDWPQDKIAARLRKIRDERGRLARQLDDTDAPQLGAAGEVLLYLLDLLADPQELYRQASKRARRVLDQNVFTKVYFDADENGPYVAADELADLVAPLVEEARNENSGTAVEDDAAVGSSKNPLVEVPGIEPGSFVVLSGLLRAQLTMPLLGPGVHVSKMP